MVQGGGREGHHTILSYQKMNVKLNYTRHHNRATIIPNDPVKKGWVGFRQNNTPVYETKRWKKSEKNRPDTGLRNGERNLN